ncbi:LysR substrate-binding domain-containing protein [Georgenia halophila]|uniref:LysR substrate-binding domain-containing protein n=1 Tax=Georgenia halophila TaxID=620889 RepID=A0ABP8LN29_9MICO
MRYFLAVVDAGTFTAAAEAVRISQSGVSTQLQKLERELGLALIDRSARRVVLTPAGERLVPHARAAIAAVDDVAGAANDIRGLVTGMLRVATVTGMVWQPLFDALATIHTRHPGIDLRLHEGPSGDLIAQIRDGTADVALAAWVGATPEAVQTSVVFDDPLVAVVAPGHPWATRDRIRPAELARTDLISLVRGTGARAALDALLVRAGTSAEPRWEVSSPAYVQMLTSRGLGVGIVSATTARDWEDVVALRIADERARSQLGIVWKRRPSHAAQALLHLLEQPQTHS